jgi:hypothetical protein
MSAGQPDSPEQPDGPPENKVVRRRVGLPSVFKRTTKRLRPSQPTEGIEGSDEAEVRREAGDRPDQSEPDGAAHRGPDDTSPHSGP